VRSSGTTQYNYLDPVQRDTVNIGAEKDDNVTVRFVTDNTGPWFLHWYGTDLFQRSVSDSWFHQSYRLAFTKVSTVGLNSCK
jgi:hypothetical protein